MDVILEESGSCGRFQIIHVILTQMTRLVAFWVQSLMVFGTYQQAWRCTGNTSYYHPYSPSQNYSPTLTTSSSAWSSHQSFVHETSYNNMNLNNNNNNNNSSIYTGQITTAATLSGLIGRRTGNDSMLDRNEAPLTTSHNATRLDVTTTLLEGSCDTLKLCNDTIEFQQASSSIVSEFELICDKAWVPRILISINVFGTFFGSLFGGQLGEFYGRKVGLYSHTAVLSLSCGLSTLSTSWEMYAVFLFFSGFGVGGILATSVVFGTEFLNSRWRGFFGSIPFWNIGLIIFSVLVFFLKDWKHIHLITSALGFLVLFGAFWMPESLRWLVVHGKTDKARRVLKRIASYNNDYHDDKESEDGGVIASETETFTEVRISRDEKAAVSSPTANKATYLDLFRGKKMCAISIKLGLLWIIVLLCFYSMSYGVSSLAGDFYTNFLVGSAIELAPVLVAGFLSNKFGRKKATNFFICVSSICCFGSAICRLVGSTGHLATASTILVFIAKAFAGASLCVYCVLSVETFPTEVRNLGYGYLTALSRVGVMLSPLLIPQDNTEYVVCYTVMGFALCVAVFIVSTLVETRNRAMQDRVVK